jgi:hypothetical protein
MKKTREEIEQIAEVVVDAMLKVHCREFNHAAL